MNVRLYERSSVKTAKLDILSKKKVQNFSEN